jgi:hypothetical protein
MLIMLLLFLCTGLLATCFVNAVVRMLVVVAFLLLTSSILLLQLRYMLVISDWLEIALNHFLMLLVSYSITLVIS